VERLKPGPNRPDFERAFVELAEVLGFQGQRPEQELSAGPDVVWALGGLSFVVVESTSGSQSPVIDNTDLVG
jgi:hypothetical protein